MAEGERGRRQVWGWSGVIATGVLIAWLASTLADLSQVWEALKSFRGPENTDTTENTRAAESTDKPVSGDLTEWNDMRELEGVAGSGILTLLHNEGGHKGIHIKPETDSRVHATGTGVVKTIDYRHRPEGATPGWYITIDHGCGIGTEYQGLAHPIVQEGTSVDSGALIGFIGAGNALDGELHYSVTIDGTPVNPLLIGMAKETSAMEVQEPSQGRCTQLRAKLRDAQQ